jgi:uncharacterized protein YcnI
MRLQRFLGAAMTVLAALAIASPALAHIDPDPTDAQAGSKVSVGFTVQHGCDGSPTVQLDMRLPDGVNDPIAEPPNGWTGLIDDNIVTFQGGPLPDEQELTFRVRMILPPTPDTTIYFPFVQRCEAGEIRWIDIPRDGNDTELDEPAPAMLLFGPVVATQPAPPTTAASTTSTTAPPTPSTTMPSTTTTTVSPTTGAAVDAASSVAPSSDVGEVDDGGSLGTLFFVLSIAAVALMGTLAVRQSRRSRR